MASSIPLATSRHLLTRQSPRTQKLSSHLSWKHHGPFFGDSNKGVHHLLSVQDCRTRSAQACCNKCYVFPPLFVLAWVASSKNQLRDGLQKAKSATVAALPELGTFPKIKAANLETQKLPETAASELAAQFVPQPKNSRCTVWTRRHVLTPHLATPPGPLTPRGSVTPHFDATCGDVTCLPDTAWARDATSKRFDATSDDASWLPDAMWARDATF